MQIRQFLGKWGIHSFLLPVFFVLHNYLQYHGLVSAGVALEILAAITGIALLFFLCIRALINNTNSSLQITTLSFFIILFYGVLKDFISIDAKLTWLARYTVMLPWVTVLAVILYIIILRKKDFFKANLFQNILLIVFIFGDLLSVFFSHSDIFLNRNMLVKKNMLSINDIDVTAERPDVYFLLFDSYPGTAFLRNYLQFNNDGLDSALHKRGFRVVGNPTSNYNRTAFSITSEFNFEYLKEINNNTRLSSDHYNRALLTIRNALVPQVFERLRYKIYNLSIFEFANQLPVYKESFLTSPEQYILLYNTLPGRIRIDIAWNFSKGRHKDIFNKQTNNSGRPGVFADDIKRRDFNNEIADSIVKIPGETIKTPRFVYAHFYLPHPPYFYDGNGKPNDLNLVLNNKSYFSRKLFFSYLQYTNKIMLKVIDTILTTSRKPPVIIIQSDHSSTDYEGCPDIPYLCFKNYTAFYFPDKQYPEIYDTISNINTFPVIFNKYFKTHIPMQKDTSFYLHY